MEKKPLKELQEELLNLDSRDHIKVYNQSNDDNYESLKWNDEEIGFGGNSRKIPDSDISSEYRGTFSNFEESKSIFNINMTFEEKQQHRVFDFKEDAEGLPIEKDLVVLNVNTLDLGELHGMKLKSLPDYKREVLSCSYAFCTDDALYYTDEDKLLCLKHKAMNTDIDCFEISNRISNIDTIIESTMCDMLKLLRAVKLMESNDDSNEAEHISRMAKEQINRFKKFRKEFFESEKKLGFGDYGRIESWCNGIKKDSEEIIKKIGSVFMLSISK